MGEDDHVKLGYDIRAVRPGTAASSAGVVAHDRLLALSSIQARDMTTDDVGQFIRYSARPITLRFLEKGTNPAQHVPIFIPGIQTSKAVFNPRHLDAAGLLQCRHPITPTREYLATLKEAHPSKCRRKMMEFTQDIVAVGGEGGSSSVNVAADLDVPEVAAGPPFPLPMYANGRRRSGRISRTTFSSASSRVQPDGTKPQALYKSAPACNNVFPNCVRDPRTQRDGQITKAVRPLNAIPTGL